MSSDAAIEVVGLSKCYHIYDRPRDRLIQMLTRGRKGRHREFWALRDASFSIARGETVGIIGRNGSGKSTLLQIICGTVSPTAGTVATYGRVAALLELGAGFNTEFTGRENVLLNAAILGFPRESMEERMREVSEFSELGQFLDRPVKTYSTGMYARLAFSIAIHVDPEILIVDEALAVGDSRFVAKCMRRMREIQDRGVTILFVSHDVSSVRTLCQRVIWLDEGRIVENGDVFPVTGKYMEFMFRDEETEEQTLREEIVASQDAAVEAGDAEAANDAGDVETGDIESGGVEAAEVEAGKIETEDEIAEVQTATEAVDVPVVFEAGAGDVPAVNEAGAAQAVIETADVQAATNPETETVTETVPEAAAVQAVIEAQDVQTEDKLSSALALQSEYELDARPVTHWGSRKGVILGAAVCGEDGAREDVIAWGKPIKLVVDVCVPPDIPRERLSVACSIKDLKGTDLIVSTTQDQGVVELPHQERFRVCFRMINPLVTGKYLLVVAVENRVNKDIHYYEYLEGAHYFSSLADVCFFGIFQPEIQQSIQVL